ncbi:hypothetical protein BDZ91DRAFT_520830 [Kalaharituber pfeilii]|nr:hypothetical protein BDZ91DRAFT_520830 [Kalaharituber pfeilii]
MCAQHLRAGTWWIKKAAQSPRPLARDTARHWREHGDFTIVVCLRTSGPSTPLPGPHGELAPTMPIYIRSRASAASAARAPSSDPHPERTRPGLSPLHQSHRRQTDPEIHLYPASASSDSFHDRQTDDGYELPPIFRTPDYNAEWHRRSPSSGPSPHTIPGTVNSPVYIPSSPEWGQQHRQESDGPASPSQQAYHYHYHQQQQYDYHYQYQESPYEQPLSPPQDSWNLRQRQKSIYGLSPIGSVYPRSPFTPQPHCSATSLRDLINRPEPTIDDLRQQFHPGQPSFQPTRAAPSPNWEPGFMVVNSPDYAPESPTAGPTRRSPSFEEQAKRPMMAKRTGGKRKRQRESVEAAGQAQALQSPVKRQRRTAALAAGSAISESIRVQVPASSESLPASGPSLKGKEKETDIFDFNEMDEEPEPQAPRPQAKRVSGVSGRSSKPRPSHAPRSRNVSKSQTIEEVVESTVPEETTTKDPAEEVEGERQAEQTRSRQEREEEEEQSSQVEEQYEQERESDPEQSLSAPPAVNPPKKQKGKKKASADPTAELLGRVNQAMGHSHASPAPPLPDQLEPDTVLSLFGAKLSTILGSAYAMTSALERFTEQYKQFVPQQEKLPAALNAIIEDVESPEVPKKERRKVLEGLRKQLQETAKGFRDIFNTVREHGRVLEEVGEDGDAWVKNWLGMIVDADEGRERRQRVVRRPVRLMPSKEAIWLDTEGRKRRKKRSRTRRRWRRKRSRRKKMWRHPPAHAPQRAPNLSQRANPNQRDASQAYRRNT